MAPVSGICLLRQRLQGGGLPAQWAGRTVAELLVYVHTKMPPDTPGRLTEQESADAIAHMFAVSNVPAGDKELSPDAKALADTVIEVPLKK